MSEVRLDPAESAFTFPTSWSISRVFVFGAVLGLFCVSTALPTDNLFRKALRFEEECTSRLELIWEPDSLSAWSPDQALTAPPIGWGVRKIGADSVWATGTRGAGVVVAVLGTGVRYTHLDLASHLWTNDDEIPNNGVDDDSNGFVDDYIGWDFLNWNGDPMDDVGHGTVVAGLVLGDGRAGYSTGVAPEAELMSLKVCAGGSCFLAQIWQAIYYAAFEGADVICLPFGWWDGDRDRWRRNCKTLTDLFGVLFVSGTGYPVLPHSVPMPAAIPPPWLHPDQTLRGEPAGLITAAPTDSLDYYSGKEIGPAVWVDFPYVPGDPDLIGLIKPDLTAPGVRHVSLDYRSDTGYVEASGCYGIEHVAGAAALIRSALPFFTPAEINSVLEMTAVDLGTDGKDNFYGAGRVDVWAAYQYCVPGIEEETRRDTHGRLVEASRLECSPNPSFGPIAISYAVETQNPITIQIYDLSGRTRQKILITDRTSGQGTIHWDGRDSAGRKLPSGIYFVRLSAGSQTFSQKIALMN